MSNVNPNPSPVPKNNASVSAPNQPSKPVLKINITGINHLSQEIISACPFSPSGMPFRPNDIEVIRGRLGPEGGQSVIS